MKSEQPSLAPHIVELICAKWQTHLLSTAAELKIADEFSAGPRSSGEVAKNLGTNPAVTHRLLRALATLGLFEQAGDQKFRLTEMGQAMRSDVPGSLRALAMMIGSDWHNRLWEKLPDCVRGGGSGAERAFGMDLWKYLDGHEKDFGIFNEAMTGASEMMHATAVEAYDFSGARKIVDVGGGHGRLVARVLEKYPSMTGMVFDRPSLAEGANAELRKLGISDRCEFVGGDFFKEIPAGGDIYMMAHIIHDWADPEATTILRTTRKAMRPGARILVLDAVIKSGPERDWGKLMDVEMMLLFGGRDRTTEELGRLFEEAGFALKRVIPTRSSTSITEGVAV